MRKSEIPINQEEDNCEKLLHLIEDGDATQILSAEYSSSLNELVKNEFITLEGEKLALTIKGRQAKILGVKALMNTSTTPVQKQVTISDFPEVSGKREINPALIIILLFFLVALVAMFVLMAK